jgi:hypothetical protein
MTDKTWKPWPEAKPLPLEETYVFDASIKLTLTPQQEQKIMRWLNATHPEQHAIEAEAFHRQQRGEPLYDSDEQMKASYESELVQAHYAFRRNTRFEVKLELSRDGVIRLAGNHGE